MGTEGSSAVAAAAPAACDVFDEHFPFVWRTVVHFGVARSDADDVTQEVFLIAFRRLDRFDASRPIRPWLAGIAYNCVRDHRRARRSRPEDATETEKLAAIPQNVDREKESGARLVVLHALASLPDDARALVVMHDVEGFAMREIADELGINESTGYARLAAAREH